MYQFLTLDMGTWIDSTFHSFDYSVFEFFHSIQSSVMTAIANFFTCFGDEFFIIPMLVLGLVLCLFKKTRKYGFAVFISILIGTLITNVILKPLVFRARPVSYTHLFCGVTGLKPTYGSVSRYGLIAYASSLDQIGPISKNVMDAAALFSIISGKDEKDGTSMAGSEFTLEDIENFDLKGKVIGIPSDYFGEGINLSLIHI